MLRKMWPVIVALVAFGLLFGCSKKSTKPKELTPGDPNDPLFLQMRSASESFTSQFVHSLGEGINWLNLSGGLAKPADTTYLAFDDETFWWVFVIDRMDDSVFTPFMAVDSFRFEAGDDYQQYPNTQTTALEYRYHGTIDYENEDTVVLFQAADSCYVSGVNDDTLVVSARAQYGMEGTIGGVEFEHELDGHSQDVTYPSVLLGADNQHPISGAATLNIALNTAGQIGELPQVNATWKLLLTFTEDGYHARLESDKNYWEWEAEWADLGPSRFPGHD